MAVWVYENVFKDGKPTPHILLRDYARGVIEDAGRRRLLPELVDIDLVRPPYKSGWPLKIPSEVEIEGYGDWRKHSDSDDIAQVHIYDSVMGSITGDFSHYVIGSRSEWFRQQIGELFGQNQAAVDHFVQSLSKEQEREWNKLEEIQRGISLISIKRWLTVLDEMSETVLSETDESAGTNLPSQRACLEIMGLAGEGHARSLAEVCAALALAGELSIIGALSAGEFARAHKRLARGKATNAD